MSFTIFTILLFAEPVCETNEENVIWMREEVTDVVAGGKVSGI